MEDLALGTRGQGSWLPLGERREGGPLARALDRLASGILRTQATNILCDALETVSHPGVSDMTTESQPL